MKAIIISALLFFSLRAMSAEVGEDKKGECAHSVQTAKREAKVVEAPVKSTTQAPAKVKSI